MNDDKLIECVRQHVVLYDLSDPKYMNTNAKNDVWEKIGAGMNVTGTACKTRWYNIRDTYRKSLKRTAAKSRQGATTIKVYKYAHQLSFLNRYLEERETLNNICSQEEVPAESCNVQIPELFEASVQERNEQGTPQTPKTPVQSARKISSIQSVVSKKVNLVGESASPKLMDYSISKNYNPTPQQHPVDVFLNAMAPSLKNLPPYEWHLAKSEIFNTVQKYELQNIMGSQNYVTLDNPSSSPSGMSVVSNESVFKEEPSGSG